MLGLGQQAVGLAPLAIVVVVLPVPAVAQVPEAETHKAATQHRLIEVKTLMGTSALEQSALEGLSPHLFRRHVYNLRELEFV